MVSSSRPYWRIRVGNKRLTCIEGEGIERSEQPWCDARGGSRRGTLAVKHILSRWERLCGYLVAEGGREWRRRWVERD